MCLWLLKVSLSVQSCCDPYTVCSVLYILRWGRENSIRQLVCCLDSFSLPITITSKGYIITILGLDFPRPCKEVMKESLIIVSADIWVLSRAESHCCLQGTFYSCHKMFLFLTLLILDAKKPKETGANGGRLGYWMGTFRSTKQPGSLYTLIP